MLKIKKLLLVFFVIISTVAYAMPPKPGIYPDGTVFVEKTDISKSAPQQGVYAKSISYYNPYSYSKINPLFVLVDFSDKSFSSAHDTGYYEDLMYASTGKSLKTFYQENSGGKLEVVNGGFYQVVLNNPYAMKAYGRDYFGIGSDNEPSLLAIWVVEQIDYAGFDLSNFDANGDGIVDALIVIHAGNGQEESGQSDDIWSFKDTIQFGSNNYYETNSGYKFIDYMMVAETSLLGTFCHEFGHILGLPDLYNTISGNSTCGDWDLMDSGGWVDDGYTPSHISAWCKKYLGWGNTVTTNEKSNFRITPTEKLDDNASNNEFYRINILGKSNEYFLLEYRNQTGFDEYLPDRGMLVWHVDEELLDSRLASNRINTGSPDNSLELVRANGVGPGSSTQATNLFRHGDVFEYPLNKSFDGKNSNIILNNFVINTDYMDFSTYALKTNENISISEFFNYPNPTYNGRTTFKLDIDNPLSGITEFKIYDISGKLIYKRNITQSDLDFSASSDYHFVYKFDWDCKDLNDNKVASDVYIYFVNVKNIRKAGKLAVLR